MDRNTANDSALATYFGDVLLVDGGSTMGVFNSFAEGDAVGDYIFTYAIGGSDGQIGLVQVPEPTNLAMIALLVLGLVARRRCK